MRRVFGCALALILVWAPAASAQSLDRALARLPCETPGDPPAAPGRRASDAQMQAALAAANAWVEQHNRIATCYADTMGAVDRTETALVDAYNRQNTEANAARDAWLAAEAAHNGGRAQ